MMSKLNLSKTYHPAGILFLGLVIAQAIATVQVYFSNIELHRAVSSLFNAGYLTVPNVMVMNRLLNFGSAFWGGLFFTCSIGAGISFGGMAAGWIWSRLCGRNRFVLFIFLSIWGGLLVISNIHGMALYPTLYCALIAPILFLLTVKWSMHSAISSTRRTGWLHIIPIPLLALLWFTQFDTELFVDLRDNLLLSNYFGKKFSHFYYKYTLYPAEAFKSLDQKLIRTCDLGDISNPELKHKLTTRLLAFDYLPIADSSSADLKINRIGDHLVFSRDERMVMKINAQEFFAKPQKALQKYSEEQDRNGAFRQFTFLSLLIGFPVLVYILAHFVIYYLFALFLSQKRAATFASVLCLLIGLFVLVYFQANRRHHIQVKNIADALDSEILSERIAALKFIQQKKMDIAGYRSYTGMLKSPYPQERYWLAVAMAVSKNPKSFSDLLVLSEDNNINVRCMAFNSLGAQKNRRAIKPILEKIKISHDWYSQSYAYRALRSLGWKQKKLP